MRFREGASSPPASTDIPASHYSGALVAGTDDQFTNGVELVPAASGSPTVKAVGDDTNIGLKLDGKGTGGIVPQKVLLEFVTAFTDATAGNLTLTAAQILGGLVLRDPNGAPRTDTLPTAALLVAAIPGAKIGTAFRFVVRNNAGAANAITIAAGSGGTTSGTMTIAQNNSKEFLVVLTNVTGGAEAYTVYSLGTATF